MADDTSTGSKYCFLLRRGLYPYTYVGSVVWVVRGIGDTLMMLREDVFEKDVFEKEKLSLVEVFVLAFDRWSFLQQQMAKI